MSHTNPPVPRRLRYEVLRRDGHTCRYCGVSAPDAKLVVDHVLPRALGGLNEPTNLVTACEPCNAGKASTSPDEHVVADVDELATKYAAALELAAQRQRQRLNDLLDVVYDWHINTWCRLFGWNDDPDAWETTVLVFVERGLELSDLKHLSNVTHSRGFTADRAWTYFCGCCWNILRQREDEALRIMRGDN